MLNTYKQEVKKHLTLLDVDPRLRTQLETTIERWYCSGPEFVVERLKTVKLCLVHYWAGDENYLSHAVWFKRSKDGVGLAGPFRHLFKANPSASFKRYCLAICNTAKLFKPTPKTLERKIQESILFITEPYRGVPIELPSGFHSGLNVSSPEEVLTPNLAGFNTAKPEGFFKGFNNPWMDSMASTQYSRLPYEAFLDTSGIKPEALMEGDRQVAGILAFLTKDGAAKVRTICLPIAECQVAMLPMHRALANSLRNVREDCTFDQEEGAAWAHEQLSQGHTIHSVDLKSATERFPRDFQLAIARISGLSENWIKAFESFAGAEFEIPSKEGEDFKVLRYSVGQPMGLYASFPLLAFGQHGLIRLAAYNCRRSWKNAYRVLGDDVIINDDIIANEYRSLLQKYDIPVSEAKCIVSSQLAEFAGFVITRDGYHKGVKPSMKSDLGSLINYVKTLGRIPTPLTGDLSIEVLSTALKEHGGLGLNPKGLTKGERALFFDDVRGTELDQQLENVPSFEGIRSAFQRAFYAKGSAHYSFLLSEYLGSYLEHVEKGLEVKLERAFPSLYAIPGFLSHACYLDQSFLLGTDPFREPAVVTRKWVRKKYPYFFMLHQEG
jgi:hypothetical protein